MPDSRAITCLSGLLVFAGCAGLEVKDDQARPARQHTVLAAHQRHADVDATDLDQGLLEVGRRLDEERDFPPSVLTGDDDAVITLEELETGVTEPVKVSDDLLGHGALLALFQQDHPLVERWIDYFTSEPGRSQYARFLTRMRTYGPQVERWIVREGLPPELIWLAFIESGMNPRAYSRAHAAGMWQFISATGRRYGLRRDFWVDDRRDVERATRAAAQHLRDLYPSYGNWALAFSAYNAGPGRVARAVRRAGHTNYWDMIRHPWVLPRETRHYVPKLVAARRIGQDPEAYGFEEAEGADSVAVTTVTLPGGVPIAALASSVGVPERELRTLNLHLRRSITPPERETYVHVPVAAATATTDWLARTDLPRESRGRVYRVRRGDTLWEIARAYRTSVRELMALNDLRWARIHPGQRLVVPDRSFSQATGTRTSSSTQHLVVQPGDSLSGIARRIGTSVASLRETNGLTSDRIYAGQRLRIPADASFDSGELRRYRVRRGDTLWEISRRFGVSVRALRGANGLRSNRIKAGDILMIPISVS